MVKEFVTQTRGIKVASTASEQELMKMVMSRLEKFGIISLVDDKDTCGLSFIKNVKGYCFPRTWALVLRIVFQNPSSCVYVSLLVVNSASCLFRYEQELINPVKNLLGGELARALLIQVPKSDLNVILSPFIF